MRTTSKSTMAPNIIKTWHCYFLVFFPFWRILLSHQKMSKQSKSWIIDLLFYLTGKTSEILKWIDHFKKKKKTFKLPAFTFQSCKCCKLNKRANTQRRLAEASNFLAKKKHFSSLLRFSFNFCSVSVQLLAVSSFCSQQTISQPC